MTFIEFIGALLIFGPPLISAATCKSYWPYTEFIPIIACWLTSLAIGAGACWLTSLLVPLYLPVFTGLAAYWFAYYKMEENFRDAITGGKLEQRTTARPKQEPAKDTSNNKVSQTVTPIKRETEKSHVDKFGLWCIALFLLAVAVLYVTGRMVGTIG